MTTVATISLASPVNTSSTTAADVVTVTSRDRLCSATPARWSLVLASARSPDRASWVPGMRSWVTSAT